MPRAEAKAIADEVLSAAREVLGAATESVPAGSYRRGRETCGDIDCIVTDRARKELPAEAMREIVGVLRRKNLVAAELAAGSFEQDDDEEHTQQNWKGVVNSVFGGKRHSRRLDILLVPPEEHAFALLHFTGSGIFNRSIRTAMHRVDMKITQKGLYEGVSRRRVQGVLQELNKGIKVNAKFTSEEDIFTYLNLPYAPPECRDIGKGR